MLLPIFIQEAHFLVLLAETWKPIAVSGGRYQVTEGEEAGVSWHACGGGSGSGGEGCSLVVEDGRSRCYWDAGQNFGSSWIWLSRDEEKPRLLVYQPILGFSTSHTFTDNPDLLQPGIWVISPTPQGYEREPIVTNRVSLLLRNPAGLFMGIICLIDHLGTWLKR